MPLSDIEIWAEIGAGYLVITPLPTVDRVVASSIDLLLHQDLLLLPDEDASGVEGVTIDPSHVNVMEFFTRFSEPL